MIRIGIDIGSDTLKAAILSSDRDVLELIGPIRIKGMAVSAIREVLEDLLGRFGNDASIGVTGSNSFSLNLGKFCSEPIAVKDGVRHLGLDVMGAIVAGASTQSYLKFERDNGRISLSDFCLNGKCGGGSGLLLDHMAERFGLSLEEFSEIASTTDDTVPLAKRCGAFRESDTVHQQQKGIPKAILAASLYKSTAESLGVIIKETLPPDRNIAFLGGLSQSKAFMKHALAALHLEAEKAMIPEYHQHIGAIGAALNGIEIDVKEMIDKLEKKSRTPLKYKSAGPLQFKKSRIMRMEEHPLPEGSRILLAALGVDIGSVSTKAALIMKTGNDYAMVAHHYRRTEADPLGAVKDVVSEIYKQVSDRRYKLERVVAGTTGSGREASAFFIGADPEHISNEISAQAAGITAIFPEEEFSVVEFGGQDSKFISIQNGVAVDFEMNLACAAGTGALIEKFAKRRGISFMEIGDLALKGKNPPHIDSTCAVLSEQALIFYEQNNVPLEDLCAALCLATATNYKTKVVRGRKVSELLVFQGAVAFNRGMVAAVETVFHRGVIVPPWPHITGALGAARIVHDSYEASGSGAFRGFEAIRNLRYQAEPYHCDNEKCGNECVIVKVSIAGGEEEFFIGDRCGRYSSKAKNVKRTGISDFFQEWERIKESYWIQT